MDTIWKEKTKSNILSSMIIDINNLTIAYNKKVTIFSELSLQMEKNEIIALIGENGAGKSTLLKTISGLLDYQSGSIQLFNQDLKKWNKAELAKKMAYVSSNEKVNSSLTVQQFVAFGRYPYLGWMVNLTEKDNDIISQAIADCKITYLQQKSMSQLSDGERQKVYLARSIAQNTDLIILDEPTTHLDVRSSKAMFELINIQKEQGKSIIFSSHQIEKALEIADQVWIVHCGQVVKTTPELFWKNEKLKELIY